MTRARRLQCPRALLRLVAPCVLLVLGMSGGQAQQPALIGLVADGKPWSLTQTGGQTGKVTLLADGKASMQMGSRSLSPTWRVSDNGQLCLKPAFVIPERCATLKRDGAAIVGVNGGAEQFRLTRP